MSEDISLYIHLPFCLSKCRYCDFYSVPFDDSDLPQISRYIDALAKEFAIYGDLGVFEDKKFKTIYVGGGTPSILTVDLWEKLDNALFSEIDKSNLTEWSVECNPESFTMEKARAYANSGVTRLTFGVQSLNARELLVCGRAHGAEKAYDVLCDYRLSSMFDSVGVDLIYGLPGQTIDTLDDTISRVLSIPHVKHLSAYELTIAEGTPFDRHRKKLRLPGEDTVAEMYYLIGRRCAERGMRQYEVSNYALPGYESIHNRAYWSHKPYMGLGASAHSYVYPKRWSNVADARLYVSKILCDNKNAVDREELLTPLELSREIIFLGLRNNNGIDERTYRNITGLDFLIDNRENDLRRFIDAGLLVNSGTEWIPTSEGMLFADMMARKIIA